MGFIIWVFPKSNDIEYVVAIGGFYELYGILIYENDDVLVLTFNNLDEKFLPLYNYHKNL